MKSIWLNASAGTGKTKSLVDRYIELLSFGFKPNQILCITFTNNAAQEMLGRIFAALKDDRKLLDSFLSHSSKIQTLHSVAQDILQNITETKIESILDDHQKKQIIKNILLDFFKENSEITEKLADLYAYEFFLSTVINAVQKSSKPIKTLDEFEAYENFKSIFDGQEASIPNEYKHIFDGDQEEYFNFFLTQKGLVRKSIIKAAEKQKYPEFAELLDKEAQNVFEYTQSQKIQDWIKINHMLIEVINSVGEKFRGYKKVHNLYDYSDLIFKSAELLEDQNNLYQVTKNIHHILLDEAQDTSFHQWQLILKLTENFFDDLTQEKTLFVVGDNKQNIYSFQDAYPKYYERYKEYYRDIIGEKFEEKTLDTNYRSLPEIVSFAEKTCTGLDMPKQMTKREGRGSIKTLPFDDSLGQSHAAYIGAKIQELLKQKPVLPSTGKAIEPKDILVLFRKRDESFNELIDHLKSNTDIPVSFETKSLLQDEPLIEMIRNLITLQIWTEDPYSLYQLGKTPFSNQQFSTVAEFIYYLVSNAENIESFYGDSSIPLLEKFFDICAELQSKMPTTFYVLKDYFDNTPISFDKKEKDENALSLMTIHGSKGLQFPVVFLVDTSARQPYTQFLWDLDSSSLYTMPPSDIHHPVITGIKDQHKKEQEEEGERLLYVAITRAKDHFYFVPYLYPEKGCYYKKIIY